MQGSALQRRLPEGDSQTRLSLEQLTLNAPNMFKEKAFIAQGTFGMVYQARIGGQLFALKKIKMEAQTNGFPITSIREIMILQKLKDHPNIVQLVDIARSKGQSIYLVFEFASHDLQKIIEQPNIVFTKMQLKFVLKQILQGLEHMHSKRIMHRDIKGGNILMNDQGIIKLADFGLSRDMIPLEQRQQYTTRVVTRWFRAPELAIGDPRYDLGIDVWSVGCTFAELIARKTLFPSRSDLEHFPTILRQLQLNDDLPRESDWPGFSICYQKCFPDGMPERQNSKSSGSLKNFFAALPPTAQNILADDETIAILELMLQVCPKKRPSCHDLLQHEYFKDLDPNFKLHIDGLHTQKPQFVDVDDSQLGKRVREVTEIVDLEIEVGKRQKLIQ